MLNKFTEFREQYSDFIYNSFSYKKDGESLKIEFDFEIPGLASFKPQIEIDNKYITNKSLDNEILNNLIFNIGMIEALSYLKSTCSKNVIVKAGFLNEEQIKWWTKLYYLGLGEFLYKNNIDVSIDELFSIKSLGDEINIIKKDFDKKGNLICIGGGKDSNVVLELLKDYENTPIVMNPKQAHFDCINVAGYPDAFIIKRTIDKGLLELNKKGFLNGHTPFSSLVSFVTYLCAYLANKEYIVLSNESSANEPTILNTNINHQYSKSIEYENDFRWYAKNYLMVDVSYFSLLRCLNETQIAFLFSKYKKYHKVFKSCNVGSKENPWIWCCNCPKCLFVYTILSPNLTDYELVNIFGENLFEKESLLNTFKELSGYSKTKPFECVGTVDEVRDAITKSIKLRKDNLPFLLKYYQENYPLEEFQFLNEYNEDNNIPDCYKNIVRDELDKYAK